MKRKPWPNHAPWVAFAGLDQIVEVTHITVALSGGGSYDSDGDSLMTDDWLLTSVPAGSTAVINNLAGVNPTFDFDLVGNLRSAAYRK